MEIINDIDSKKELGQSPLFQLSLASKELFHTNFLYWLAQNYRTQFFNLLEKLFDGEENHLEKWEDEYCNGTRSEENVSIIVKREKNNFDLSIWRKRPSSYKRTKGNKNKGNIKRDNRGNIIYDYTPLLVIENKVKSVIYKDQLDRYENKLKENYNGYNENVDLILLSLAEVPEAIIQNRWKVIRYNQLKDAIEYCFLQNQDEQSLTYLIIKDYCNFIGNLHRLAQNWSKEEKLFEENQDAKDLRLDDIRQKIIFSKAANVLQEKLNGQFNIARGMNKQEMYEMLNSRYKNSNDSSPIVFINEGYMRSGLLDIKFQFDEKNLQYLNVIQVQDRCIRYAIEYNKEDKNRTENCDSVKKDLQKAWEQILSCSDLSQIGHFGTNFFFYKCKISDDQTILNVAEKIRANLLKAKEAKEQKKLSE